MFAFGRIGKLMIAAQIGMKLYRMARTAKAKRDEKKMMGIAPNRFTQGERAGVREV